MVMHIPCNIYLEGTLTKPCIDFKKMRQRLGIEVGDVLTVIHSYEDPKRREEAMNIIDEVEEEVFSILFFTN